MADTEAGVPLRDQMRAWQKEPTIDMYPRVSKAIKKCFETGSECAVIDFTKTKERVWGARKVLEKADVHHVVTTETRLHVNTKYNCAGNRVHTLLKIWPRESHVANHRWFC